MYTYFKYIAKNLFLHFVIISAVLTSIIWLKQSAAIVNLAVNNGININDFLKLSSLILPSLLYVILPISLAISTIFYMNKIIQDKEIIILRTAGLSNWQIVKPILLVAVSVMILHYFVSLYLLPGSHRHFKNLQSHLRNNYFTLLLQEGSFSNQLKNITLFVNEKTGKGNLRGVFVHDSRADKAQTISASTGEIYNNIAGTPIIKLHDGTIQQYDNDKKTISLVSFEEYIVDLAPRNSPTLSRTLNPDEQYIGELYKNAKLYPKKRNKFISHAQQRLLWPLYSIILALSSVFVLLNYSTGNSRKSSIVSALLVSCLLISFLLINHLVLSNLHLIPILYSFTILSLAGSIYSVRVNL